MVDDVTCHQSGQVAVNSDKNDENLELYVWQNGLGGRIFLITAEHSTRGVWFRRCAESSPQQLTAVQVSLRK